jgi:hypothetical protein
VTVIATYSSSDDPVVVSRIIIRPEAPPRVARAPAPTVPAKAAPAFVVPRTPRSVPGLLPDVAAVLPLPLAPPVAVATAAGTAPRAAIEAIIDGYRRAYERLDAQAARQVWPSVDADELARAFRTLSRQEMSFQRCDIDAAAAKATARCLGELRYVRRVGGPTMQRRSVAWTFDLVQANRRWTIERVQAR